MTAAGLTWSAAYNGDGARLGDRAERLLAAARLYRERVLSGAIDVTQKPESEEEAVATSSRRRG